MPTPPLCVIIPNYNHAKFLPRCLDSILGQSFTDFELIVVDDGSTDGSVELLDAYARRDARVKFLRNPRNVGPLPTLNRALALARGEYVLGGAADDYLLPGYFEPAVALLRQHPQAGVCLGITRNVHDSGLEVGDTPGVWSDRPAYLSPDEVAARITRWGVPGTAIWRKDAFLRAGGYDPGLRWHSDWFPTQVVAARHGVCFLPQHVGVCRITSGAYSASQGSPMVQRQVLRTMLARLLSPDLADVHPWFVRSGILRQFGPEMVRAAVTTDVMPPELLALVRELLLVNGVNLLRDRDPAVRRGVAIALGRFGRDALSYDPLLEELTREPIAEVASAAVEARAGIWKETPFGLRLRRRVRAAVGAALRALDRFSRPLHHRRLERAEMLLTDLVNVQLDLHNVLTALTAKVEELRLAQEQDRAARQAQPPPRNAAA
jgi:hypothetical protein